MAACGCGRPSGCSAACGVVAAFSLMCVLWARVCVLGALVFCFELFGLFCWRVMAMGSFDEGSWCGLRGDVGRRRVGLKAGGGWGSCMHVMLAKTVPSWWQNAQRLHVFN